MESTSGALAVFVPIALLICAIVVFLTIFLVKKLKNKLGVYICWIPSFISLAIILVLVILNKDNEYDNQIIYTVFLFFLPYFISYMLASIIKITGDRRRANTDRQKQEELDRISINDL